MRLVSIFMLFLMLASGCATTAPPPMPLPFATLSTGSYSLIQDITDIPDNQTEHSETECTVSVNGDSVVITSTIELGSSLVGSVKQDKIALTVYPDDPDPMVEAMEMSIVYEGRIMEDDFAAGRIKGYAGTNMYVTGKWTLEKTDR